METKRDEAKKKERGKETKKEGEKEGKWTFGIAIRIALHYIT
jgi:hypothetical protein